MLHKLSNAKCNAEKLTDKDKMLSDGGGLYLRVRRTSKTWVYRTKIKNATKIITLGKYPQLSLSSARKAADDLRNHKNSLNALKAPEFTINIKDDNQRKYIYFLYNDCNCVYVGQTRFIDKRLKQHIKDKEFNKYSYFAVQNNEADIIEAKYILDINPKYNKNVRLFTN